MSKRINIILPDVTVELLERVSTKGNRSRLISQAVIELVKSKGRQKLKEQLKAGYIQNAHRDLEIAQEWFPLEEEAWQKNQQTKKRK